MSFELWDCRVDDLENVIAVGDEEVILARLPASEHNSARESIGKGKHPAEVLGKTSIRIPFSALSKTHRFRHEPKLLFIYQSGGKEILQFIIVAEPRLRDEIFNSLQKRLGASWEVEERNMNFWRVPLTLTIVLALLGFVLYMSVKETESGKKLDPGNRKALLGKAIADPIAHTIGSTGVLIILSLGLILGMIWMIYSINHPPLANAPALLRRSGQTGSESS